MERAAEYDILNYIETLRLSGESTEGILQHFEEIENYLPEKEHDAWDLVYPSSRYMRCIQALVRGRR